MHVSANAPKVVTLGCRLNIYESEVMERLALEAGLENAIVVNTCAVTAEAERQTRQTIRKLRKENPHAYIIATGCAVQLRPQQFAAMPEIDRIIGNDIKLKKESFSPEFPHRMDVAPFIKDTHLELNALPALKGKTRGFLQIQNGCNHQCSFCTIPRARGKSRSAPIAQIVHNIRELLEQGVQEIIFTGVDLTSYGEGLPGSPTLGTMIKRVLMQVPHLRRLRLSSLDSIEVDEDLQRLLWEDERLLPHVHLSLQSGSNAILKTMRRRHTREDAIAFCAKLRRERPEFVFGADFIVGHPGETEEDAEDTNLLVEECGLTHLHVFPYSSRPGTLAARMTNPVLPDVIKKRSAHLRAKGTHYKRAHFQKYVGKKVTVLLEKNNQGHTNDFSKVSLVEDATAPLFLAEIIGYDDNMLYGKPLGGI